MGQLSGEKEHCLCNLFNVRGKVALVTGGGTGVGKMITEGLVTNGAKVFITSRKIDNLKKTAEELNSKCPDSVDYIISDIKNREGVEKLVKELEKRTSKLHILINNSGITWADPIDKFNEERGWDELYSVNVKAPFYLSVLLSPLLIKSSNGNVDPSRIINISSISSVMSDARKGAFFRPSCGIWSYCTSKAALNHLTLVLSNEYSNKSITVNTLMPGVFESRMTRQGLRHWPDRLKEMWPSGRYGNVCDITGCILFLCSKASSHVTGTTIIVDGGTHVGKPISA